MLHLFAAHREDSLKLEFNCFVFGALTTLCGLPGPNY